MKTTTLIAFALLAGCAGRAALPLPNAQGSLAQIAPHPASTPYCGITQDFTKTYKPFDKFKYIGLQGPLGYVAVSAAVQNDLSNGIFVRNGEHKKQYAEGSGSYTLVTFKTHKAARNVILTPIPGHKPTAGTVYLAITYCTKK